MNFNVNELVIYIKAQIKSAEFAFNCFWRELRIRNLYRFDDSVGISSMLATNEKQVFVFSKEFLEYYIKLSGYNISSHMASSFHGVL